jgi:REP element-mobilizing transposase RayT
MRKPKQQSLNLYLGKHGGRRPASGRNRIQSKGVSHRSREAITARTPVHINFKVSTYIQSKPALEILTQAIYKANTHGLNVIYYALQTNHIHLIIEAASNEILTKGMRSLTITFAKRIQKLKQTHETIQLERYHLHVLKCPKEVGNAISYVLNNEAHHSGLRTKLGYAGKINEPVCYLLTTGLEGGLFVH